MASVDHSPMDKQSADDFETAEGGRHWRGEASTLSTSARKWLGRLFFLAVASFLFGLWWHWPYFEAEHQRMEPWNSVLIWVGDTIGLAWFTTYFTRHYVLRESFSHAKRGKDGITASWWLALFSLAGGIGFDLCVTLSVRLHEETGLARAIITQGQMTQVEKKTGPTYHQYAILCRFQDRHGAWHDTQFKCYEDRRTGHFLDHLPAEVGQTLRNGQVPSPLPVAYDPEHPVRHWIAGIDPGPGFHTILLSLLMFQAIGIVCFVVALQIEISHNHALPWWYDLHMALPFMVQAAFLGGTGGLHLILTPLIHLAWS